MAERLDYESVVASHDLGYRQYWPTTFYLDHMVGETTGPDGGIFTVSFANITNIRSNVGQTVSGRSFTDIDKNVTISFADISAMRGNVGAQLTQVSLP